MRLSIRIWITAPVLVALGICDAWIVRRQSRYWPNHYHAAMPWSTTAKYVLVTNLLAGIFGLLVGAGVGAYQRVVMQRPFRLFNDGFVVAFIGAYVVSFGVIPGLI